MVGISEQRLQGLLHAQRFAAEGIGIGREIEALHQGHARFRGRADRALEADGTVDAQIAVDEERAFRDNHPAAIRRLVGGNERRAVIGLVVALSPEIAHIHPVDQRRDKGRCHVLDADRFDAEGSAVRAHQIQPEMAIDRRRSPGHVHPATRSDTDNGADLHHLAIGGQGQGRPDLDQAGDAVARPVPSPSGDPHAAQGARHGLDPGRDAQIDARDHGRLALEANACGGLLLHHLEAGAEILVRRDKGAVVRRSPGRAAGRAVRRGPGIQPTPERGRHQHKPVGDRDVHDLSPSAAAGAWVKG